MTLRRVVDLGWAVIAAAALAPGGCGGGRSSASPVGGGGASATGGDAVAGNGAGGGIAGNPLGGGGVTGGTAGSGGLAGAISSGGGASGTRGGSGGANGGAGGAVTPGGGGAGGQSATVAGPTHDFDILFMVDNSTSMQPAQTALVNAFPSLISALQALPGGPANVHVAVVASDMGAGSVAGCGTSLNGSFQTAARAPCAATMLTGSDRFISNVDGQTNYTGPVEDVFRCIAPLGVDGCGYEQPLAAIARALGADGAAAPTTNRRFLRASADLVLVLLTNEDDCSTNGGAASPLFGGPDAELDSAVGPLLSFRCNEFGHLCDQGAPKRYGNTDTKKTYTNCRSNEHSQYLSSVAAIARNIKALKPFPDQQISVTAIVGVPQAAPNGPIPYVVTHRQSAATQPWPYVAPACGDRTTENFGDPSIRLAEFARQFGGNGAVFSVCDSDYAPVMKSIAERIARRTMPTGAGGGAGGGGPAGNCAADLIAGSAHMCARKTDGALWCWGSNNDGQLGDGTMGAGGATGVAVPTPVAVAGLGAGVAEVAAGASHTCALKTDGTLWCWGSNVFGQLGDGTTTSSPLPVKVEALGTGVAHVNAGWDHTCAIKTDGTLWCWGKNTALGYESTVHQPLPKQAAAPVDSGVAQVSGGYDHTCARKTDGSAHCWGSNTYGQLGDGSVSSRPLAMQVRDLASGVAAVSVGQSRSCARKTDDTIWCWGSLVGDGTSSTRLAPVQVSPTTIGFAQLATGGESNCAAYSDGGLACWGANRGGQLGPAAITATQLAPVDVPTAGDVAQIAMGSVSVCVRHKDNSVSCWGNNQLGQLGDGTTVNRAAPVHPRLCP